MKVFTRAGSVVVFLLLMLSHAFGQVFLEGKLVNDEDNTPIPYANIGILNTSVGTISNPDGTFEIHIPEKNLSDTLLFAALGFERQSFPISRLTEKKFIHLRLKEQSTVLTNVVVKSKRLKPARAYEMGNRHFNVGSIYADSLAAGSAMALLIENKYPTFHPELALPFFVTKAKLRISFNSFDNFKVRIRFLSVDSITGLPDKDLFNESIIASSGMRKGWLTFDLSKYNIRINSPAFFLVFEWLLDDEDRLVLLEQYREFKRLFPSKVTTDTLVVDGEQITFNSWHGYRAGTSFGTSSNRYMMDNYKTYFRNNSYGKWKRSSFILSATATIVNY